MKNKEKIKRFAMAGMSFCFMLLIAGYINYKYNPEREKDLGQTVYVNSNNDKVDIYDDTQATNSQADETIASFRYDRDNMYSELSNNYSNIINNTNSTAEVISEYQNKLSALIEENIKKRYHLGYLSHYSHIFIFSILILFASTPN